MGGTVRLTMELAVMVRQQHHILQTLKPLLSLSDVSGCVVVVSIGAVMMNGYSCSRLGSATAVAFSVRQCAKRRPTARWVMKWRLHVCCAELRERRPTANPNLCLHCLYEVNAIVRQKLHSIFLRIDSKAFSTSVPTCWP